MGIKFCFRIFQEYKMTSNDNYSNGNETIKFFSNESIIEDYIFDRMDIRIIFITLYSIVFFFCCFGKLNNPSKI